MQNEINGVKEAIDEANVSLLKYSKTMREIEWGHFDYIQDRISQITSEANFLIDLMSKSNLYKDNGQFNAEGMATTGLHAQNYNVYMAQADQYAEEILALNKEIAKDPYNTELIERREELLGLQQDSILAAEDEKQAIVDLVEEGINIELEALKELIDAYTDSLDSAKDLYEYQKKIEEKTSDIAALQKQLSAYENDTSEETRAKIQQIKIDLSEAQADLAETEYDQFVSDTKKLLDNLYNEYQGILNERLDNVDALISDMINAVNINSADINNTLIRVSDEVGYTMTQSMQDIWSNSGGAANAIVSKYGDNFTNQLTTINQVLSAIQTSVAAMITASNTEATTAVSKTSSTTTPTTNPTTASSTSTTKSTTPATATTAAKEITIGGKINAGNSKIYSDSYGGKSSNQYFKSDPIYTVLGENNGYLKVRHHKLSSGVTGWFKKGDVKAYKTGGLVDYTGLAQVDGTPEKPELMLNSVDTENFIGLRDALRKMSMQPLTGITDISKSFSTISSPSISSGTTFGEINITIPIDHVENYDDFINQLRQDKKFEKFVQSISVDRLAGDSPLIKNKYKWQ